MKKGKKMVKVEMIIHVKQGQCGECDEYFSLMIEMKELLFSRMNFNMLGMMKEMDLDIEELAQKLDEKYGTEAKNIFIESGRNYVENISLRVIRS